jgi:hypothetical protein
MVDDDDIYRAAAGLTKNYGDDAHFACAEIVHRWESRGDKEAAAVWRRVISAIEELRQQRVN